MRYAQLILLLVYVMLSLSAIGQTKAAKIIGSVTANNQKSFESATAALLKAQDSSLLKSSVSDITGKFEFNNIDEGKYLVLVSAVGYQSNYSTVEVLPSTTTLILKPIQLDTHTDAMAGVVITAKRPPIEVRAGKTVVNVEASPTNAGLNVLEILEKSPGVAVDNDGNVSIKGKGGVLILIDGKQTYLSGTQLAAFLKSIQANSLDQIEIMTSPPAKYDAAGNAGVINIKTKKGTMKGMNGNVNLTWNQAYYAKYFGGANFNYRNNKLNIFGSYDGGRWEGLGLLSIDRNFYKDGSFSGSSDQATDRHNVSQWNNLKLGFDYNFTKKDVAGIVISSSLNPWNHVQRGYSNLRDPDGEINTTIISESYNANKSKSFNTNFNYKHSFDSTGREWTVDLDQGYYTNRGTNFLTTKIYDPGNKPRGNPVLLEGNLPSNVTIYTAKSDYVHPFTKTLKLEAGVKSGFVNTDNNVVYMRDTSTGWKTDRERTNHFIYKENVNAVYGILTTTIKKFEITAGLRIENTNAKGTQQLNDSSFARHYTNLFPNAGAAYTISEKHQLTAAYSRRIRRPDFEDLNPFIFFLDSLTYGKGNPYLLPEFSNRVELSHTYNKALTTTVSFTNTTNIITELLKQNTEKRTTFQTKENFSKRRQYGFSVSYNKKLASWWNFNLYSGVFYNTYRGIYTDGATNTPVKINVTNFDGNLSNSFTFSDKWSAEISGWFNSNPAEGLLIAHSMGSVNAAVSRQLFNKKATLKLGVRDIFRTTNFSGYSRYADVDLQILNNRTRDNRQLSVSFTYKFGKSTIDPERNRSGGAGEERSRVKSGG